MEAEPPDPGPTVAAACEALGDVLPAAIEEGDRRDVVPESPYTAAWGDPAIVLTCGVAQPEEYEPTSELIIVNGVDWLVVPGTEAYSFYTTGRAVWVRVDVPVDYDPPTFALTELSDVIGAAVPLRGPAAG